MSGGDNRKSARIAGAFRGARLERDALIILGIGFLVLLVGGGSRFAIGLVLKPMSEDLGWSRSVFGAAAALFLIASSVFMFVSGRLADRYSLRTVLNSGLAFSAVGLAAMYFVNAPWQMLLLYGFVFAIGNGLASIAPVGVLISRRFPGRTGFANAIATSGTGIGQLLIIGMLAATLVAIGWRQAFVWLSLVSLALIPVVFTAMRRPPQKPKAAPAQAGSPDETLGQAMRTKRLWVLVGIYAICGFQDFFVATHVVAFAQDNGVDDLMAGNLLAFMGLAGVIGVLIAGVWSDWAGPHQATITCFVLRIGLFGLILFDQSAVSISVFALLYGITFWLTAPLTVVFVRQAFGLVHLGAISGLVVMLHHMSGGIGAYLGAALFDLNGNYDVTFLIMLVTSLVATGLSWGLPKSA